MINSKHSASTRLICSLVSTTIDQMLAELASAFAAGADAVECRVDYLSQVPTRQQLKKLLANPLGEIIVTLRPTRQGGRFAGDESARLELLAMASDLGAYLIDIESDIDPASRPAGLAMISYHDFTAIPDDLPSVLAGIDAMNPSVSKIAFAANRPEDSFEALDLLHNRDSQKPAIILAMGEMGLISRVLAKKFGAFGTFASLNSKATSAPGQPTIDEFKNLYRWDDIRPSTKIFGVIGNPIAHSLSPALHNAAFSETGYDGVYLPIRVAEGADNFNRFIDAILDRHWLDFAGLSVTIPHKANALAKIGAENCDPLAVKIGAINTITIAPDGSLRGDNTDYAAAIDCPVEAMGITREQLAGKSVALLGAGGVARAVVAALSKYNAHTTIYNRTVSRANALAEEFGCSAKSLGQASASDAEIVINCTSIGMSPNVNSSPIDRIPSNAKVVFDTIYNPAQTLLLKNAHENNCLTILGVDMFIKQGSAQFARWTNLPAPTKTFQRVMKNYQPITQ